MASVAKVKAGNPDVFVGQFGGASADKALSKSFEDDFKKAEFLSLPITLIILILAFGALVAAGVPLLLGLTAVMATLGLVAIPSQFVPMDDTVSSVVLLVGLAVGVDYTLFYLRREREEKARGASKIEAVHTAAATSGRAVLVSGFTVMVAMAGMFFAGGRTFTALGVGAIMVVAVAMIGSVTVVPAVLAWLGDRIEKGRVPFLHGRRNSTGESRVFGWILTGAQAPPAVGRRLRGRADRPRAAGLRDAHGAHRHRRPAAQARGHEGLRPRAGRLPGRADPRRRGHRGQGRDLAEIQAAVKKMGDRAFATGTMNGPLSVDVSPDKHVMSVAIPMRGDGTDAASANALDALRGGIVDQTVGATPGVKSAYVTGIAAGTKDFNDLVKAHAPIVFAFVLTLAFLLLLVTFRSIVIPIKAIILNLLSVGAAYGILTWIFQDGHFQGLLGYESNGGVVSWLPLFLFVILFGLSMDYHVFILSRIREAFDRGMKTDDAIAYGIKATASTVTSAAIVMVGVFAIFATLSSLDFKQMGIGLSVAILLDATIVRAVLLPATMKLLGDWNWYLPKGLHWLPHISHEPSPEPAR